MSNAKKLAEAERAIDLLHNTSEYWKKRSADLQEQLDQAIKNLQEALRYNCKLSFESGYYNGRFLNKLDAAKEYMRHKSTCKPTKCKCTCGFDKALKYINEEIIPQNNPIKKDEEKT